MVLSWSYPDEVQVGAKVLIQADGGWEIDPFKREVEAGVTSFAQSGVVPFFGRRLVALDLVEAPQQDLLLPLELVFREQDRMRKIVDAGFLEALSHGGVKRILAWFDCTAGSLDACPLGRVRVCEYEQL